MNIAQPPPVPTDVGTWLAQFPPLIAAAIIAGIVSFTIAIITNRSQGKRERKRDRELWAREDRHRFADYKRDIYSQYLAAIDDCRTHTDTLAQIASTGHEWDLEYLRDRFRKISPDLYRAVVDVDRANQQLQLVVADGPLAQTARKARNRVVKINGAANKFHRKL